MAERLKMALQLRGMTPTALIRETGLSKAGVYFLLDGTTKAGKVRADTIAKLCAALQVNRDWLMTGKGVRDLNDPRANANREPESHPPRLDPDKLHEAITLIVFDEEVAGPYLPRAYSRRLAELYERVAADGGKLTDAHNDAFLDEVHARGNQHVATTVRPIRGRANSNG